MLRRQTLSLRNSLTKMRSDLTQVSKKKKKADPFVLLNQGDSDEAGCHGSQGQRDLQANIYGCP